MDAKRRLACGSALVVAALMTSGPPAIAQTTPTKYALVIGLNSFRHLNGRLQPLKFAAADARDVATVLERSGFIVTPLVNGQARRVDIVGELNRLARTIKRDDTFLLFFAGHGVQNTAISQDGVYWLTYDAQLDTPDIEGIRIDHLMDYVRDIRAERKIVLLDHCFSGRVGLRSGSSSLDATQPGARGAGDDTLAVARGTEALPGWTSVRPRSSGTVLIGASRELAFESDKVGHGLFTAALLEAMSSPAADGDGDRKLTALELLSYLPGAMDALAKKYNVSQQLEPLFEGRNLAQWEIVSSLPGKVDPPSIRASYTATLNRWAVRNFMTPGQKMRCARVVEKWFAAQSGGAPLDAVERNLFDAIKAYVEDPAPEEERGRNLAQHFDAVCQTSPQSDICR